MNCLIVDYYEPLTTTNFLRVWNGNLVPTTGKHITISTTGVYQVEFISTWISSAGEYKEDSYIMEFLELYTMEPGSPIPVINPHLVHYWATEENAKLRREKISYEEHIMRLYGCQPVTPAYGGSI